jgi:hypothetical protein
MCTSSTAGARARTTASENSPDSVTPSVDGKLTRVPAASADGDDNRIDSSTSDSAARYSFTTRPRPTKIARLMSAWPIETSSSAAAS